MVHEKKPHIFMLGATGYIAGSVLHLMVERDYLSNFSISALVRTPSDAEAMRQFGVAPILGDLDDLDLLEEQASIADIVINNANCDHDTSAAAIVHGLERRWKSTGARPIFIHTSGAGVLSDTSNGRGVDLAEDRTALQWDDADAAAHAAIPRHAPHRLVDLEVFAAADVGHIKTYLVVPPTVFGRGVGRFAENRMSIQTPRLAYQSLISSRALFVGTGANVWPNVHVVDLAELYLMILQAAIQGSAPEGRAGIYYPVTEHFTWLSVAQEIGRRLHARGFIDSPTPSTGLRPGWFWGSNVRMIGSNESKLGWKPTHGGNDALMEAVDWDIDLVLRMLAKQAKIAL